MKNRKKFPVIIIGAGPGGLFSAYELTKEKGVKIAIFERGRAIENRVCPEEKQGGWCFHCSPCNIVAGVGGAGGLSDGKLIFFHSHYPSSYEVGGNFEKFDQGKITRKAEEIEKIFVNHGVKGKVYGEDINMIKKLIHRANRGGIKFVPSRQRHLGSDLLPRVIKSIEHYLVKNGVEFFLEEEVIDIDPKNKEIITKKQHRFGYEFLIIAVGRGGSSYLEKWSKKLNLKIEDHRSIDVGARIEVPASIMEDLVSVIYDPKLKVITKTHDDQVRTFCTCPNGWVIRETYKEFSLVNGHSKTEEKSTNTNFALLARYTFTKPFKQPNEWGRDLARLTTKLGGGNPLVQRLKDLRLGRRSTYKRIKNNPLIRPTLESATPGDISLAYPGRIVQDLVDALEQIDRFVLGVASDATLIYVPEIKFYSFRVKVNDKMETNVNGVYAIGDGAGISRGIVGAGITGLIAGEDIRRKLGS